MYSAKFFNVFLNLLIYMRGKDIKDILAQNGISQADIAKILGISPANLNNMLAKDDVRTGLLESIAHAANIPISVFYGDSYTVHGNNNALATGDHSTANSSDDRLIALLMSKDTQLTMSMQQTSKAQEQITELIKIMQK